MTPRVMAIDGGTPAFAEPRLTGAPNSIDREAVYRRLDDMFDRRRLTNNGPMVREFEERLEALVGVNNVVSMANGTLALLIGAVALGARGEVIVPSWTFAGTVQPLVWAGLRPRFIDVDPVTHNLDPSLIDRSLPDVGLMVPVHLWGQPCDADAVQAAATELGAAVLYDAAHALGATVGTRAVGTFGAAEVFSFHATKWMTSIEGGALATDNDDLADHCRRLRNFGFAGEGEIPINGINAKMSEMHAAVGLCQLERFDDIRRLNQQRHAAYASCFEGSDSIRLVSNQTSGTRPHGYVVVELHTDHEDPARHLQAVLEAENIHVRRYFSPGVHRLEAFERFAPAHRLPITDDLSRRCLALPTGDSVSIEDVIRIAGVLIDGVDRMEAMAHLGPEALAGAR